MMIFWREENDKPNKISWEKINNFLGNISPVRELATLYLGATLALNFTVYGVQAGVDGIARACGVQTTEHVGRLMNNTSHEFMLGGTHGYVRTGTFALQDGREMVAADGIVVT